MAGIHNVAGRADINQVLANMKSMRSQIQPQAIPREEVRPGEVKPTSQVEPLPKFSDLLSNAVDAVNETQQKAGQLQKAFEQGDPNVSLAQVMIQSQKSSVSFEALTQVRNRVVKAYEDIMNMPV